MKQIKMFKDALKNQYIVEAKRDGKIIKYSLQNRFINELMNYAIETISSIKICL